MVSPAFQASHNHCLLFHYKVWMPEFTGHLRRFPELAIYISETSHVFSGSKVWGSNGTGEGLVQIPVWARSGAIYRLSFVGITISPNTTVIKLAKVELNLGNCSTLYSNSSLEADEIYDSSSKCELHNENINVYCDGVDLTSILPFHIDLTNGLLI